MTRLTVLLTAFFLLSIPGAAPAAVALMDQDDIKIHLGFRLQTQVVATDNHDGTSGDGDLEFNVRRARIRLGGEVTRRVGFFLQTESAAESGSGLDMRIIEAWVSLNLHKAAKIILGEHMAAAGRQITTSSGGLMAIDRPNINNFNLTWGMNGRMQFNTADFWDGNLDLSGQTNVRDEGATLFGVVSLTQAAHLKYYLGAYDGIQLTDANQPRYTARIQLNLFDAEADFYHDSTYMGKKKTISLGASFDTQQDIAVDNRLGAVDYTWWSFDAFADWPLGPGSITLEAGYNQLDLEDAAALNTRAPAPQDARRTQGSGWYVQTGYYFSRLKLQPWALYEVWASDAPGGGGFYDIRAGLTYFFKGHHANVKLGYEYLKADSPIAGSLEDTVQTILLGFFVTY